MTKDKAKELANILLAYSQGKTIQRELSNSWEDIEELKGEDLKQATIRLMGDFLNLRVKPEPRLVPFTLEDKEIFKNRYVKFKRGSSNIHYLIHTFGPTSVVIGKLSSNFSYKELFDLYVFEDDSPCGKIIEG